MDARRPAQSAVTPRKLDAVVVGAGPNGLAAAVTLAEAGASVLVLEAAERPGGGARTSALTVPGLAHDDCSAVHPLGVGSPFFRDLPLEHYGLRWCHPPLPLAHPLDGGDAVALHRSLDATVGALGADGDAWRRLVGSVSGRFDEIAEDVLRPITRVPRHPLATARFGLPGLLSASVLAEGFDEVPARALFAGNAAHSVLPLDRPATAAFGLLLAAAGHAVGWPVPAGGSQAITDALVAYLGTLGGRLETDRRVRSLADLPPARVALLDVTPRQLLAVAGDRLPVRRRRRLGRWRYGPAAFKLDLAVRDGIPWAADVCRQAGTVHVGGTFEEVAEAEAAVAMGKPAERPFVLVAQPAVADPGRVHEGLAPIWAYAHVPNGWQGDATEAIEQQIERFAPGFRDRIVARHVRGPQALAAYDANYVGGDISGGAHDGVQVLARPRLAIDPYRTGIDGLFLCSSSTPPGAGVHGMCGHLAARSALRTLR